jgi:hypothetical protein
MVRKKAVKYSRAHKFYYFWTDAVFAGKAVRLFFYRFGHKGEWKALLSTDTSLTPYKAYQIYSMRWSIEVSFHEITTQTVELSVTEKIWGSYCNS